MGNMLTNFYQIYRLERKTSAELRCFHERLLPAVLMHAYTQVPLYQAIYKDIPEHVLHSIRTPEQLSQLPILDRTFYRSFPTEQRFASGFTSKNTSRGLTSGSSGVPLDTYNSACDLAYLRMVYLNDLLQAGMRPWDRVAYFRMGAFYTHPLQKFGILPFYHICTADDLAKQVADFLRYKPTFISGFPSSIFALVEELKRRGIRYTGVHHVLFGGERINTFIRQTVTDYFKAGANEIYSTVETFTIARTCPAGNMHVHAGEVIVEVENENGEISLEHGEGDILITRLFAEAMPLIRYKLGDQIKLVPNDCPCGISHTPIIREVSGRSADVIVTPEHSLINGNHLTRTVEPFSAVQQLQLIQTTPKQIKILIVTACEDSSVCDQIKNVMNTAFPLFHFDVERVSSIPLEANGKVKVVKTLVETAPYIG